MPSSELQKFKLTQKSVARAVRFLQHEIKVPPRFISKIGAKRFELSKQGKL